MTRFDFSELRALILAQFHTYKAFAAAMGVPPSTLSRWLNTLMPLDALHRMVELLGVPDLEVNRVFFTRAN